jgi:glycosyltransferase involved in cell wall biosynthesis
VRLLLVQPSLDPPGGGHLVAAWVIEALRGEHNLTLLGWEPPNLDSVNRHFGTSLVAHDFRLVLPSATVRRLVARSPLPAALLKHALLLRLARRLAAGHDLLLTADNETDFGRPGIQYVHYPKLDPERPDVDVHWYHGAPLVAAYRAFTRWLGGTTDAGMRANLTLVNSAFTAARVRALHGIEPVILYPPVPGAFPAVPWHARRDGVVAIGRLSPEKRLADVIHAVRLARRSGADLDLHLIGSDSDRAYTDEIRSLIRDDAWAHLHLDLARDALLRLVAAQRYGMHAMVDEPFGIAVAEMLRAGCIPFVHASAGPREIVGDDSRLLFRNPAEAAERLLAVHRDPAAQDALRTTLAARAEQFSSDRFVDELRAIVAARGLGARLEPAPQRTIGDAETSA